MPNDYIKKLSKDGKGSVEKLEQKWNKAKSIAKSEGKSEGKSDNYAYITGIFKNMISETVTFKDFWNMT